MPLTRDEIARLVELEASLQGVDPAMALAVAQLESGFDPAVRSPKGAISAMRPGSGRPRPSRPTRTWRVWAARP